MEPLTSLFVATRTPRISPRGFSLIETLVALGIMLIIITVVMLGQDGYNKSLVLTDTSYTVAFTVRQAQALGLSSKRVGAITNSAYGVHIGAAPSTSYMLYADTYPYAPGSNQGGKCAGHTASSGPEARPGNCVYEGSPGAADTIISTYTLNKGFKILSYCGVEKGTLLTKCSGGGSGLSALDISFMRPSTQASIMGVSGGSPVELISASITVSTPDNGSTRCVLVTKVGQVSVTVCP